MIVRFALPLFFALFLFSCREDSAAGQSDGAADSDATAENAAGTTKAKAEPAASRYTPPQSTEVLFLSIDDQAAEAGEVVCTPVRAKGFNSLLSMQYTVAWDPDILQFKGLKDFGLPYLTVQNFGTTKVSEGVMPVAWIDNALKGVTVSGGSPIYTICFEALAGGQASPVRIIDQPTAIEVVNLGEQLVGLDSEPGTITVR